MIFPHILLNIINIPTGVIFQSEMNPRFRQIDSQSDEDECLATLPGATFQLGTFWKLFKYFLINLTGQTLILANGVVFNKPVPVFEN